MAHRMCAELKCSAPDLPCLQFVIIPRYQEKWYIAVEPLGANDKFRGYMMNDFSRYVEAKHDEKRNRGLRDDRQYSCAACPVRP